MDRNLYEVIQPVKVEKSLSARRAWIEISLERSRSMAHDVALRKESVDRNDGVIEREQQERRRSPQGERG